MDMTSSGFDGGHSQQHARLSAAQSWLVAITAVAATLAIGSAFGPDAWYESLRKPTWQPPNWVFGPVWSVLYLMLMVALVQLLQAPPGPERSNALRWFGAQLVLNAAWSPLFFGLKMPALALLDIGLLWLALLGSIQAAFQVRESSAWLQVPTLIWVSFALVLNGVILALNL
jgi:translocator protein